MAGLLSLGIAGYAASRVLGAPAGQFHGTPYPDTPPAPEFALTDHRGETATLSALRGKSVLLFFGFTSCPDVCPLTLAAISRILDAEEITPEEMAVLLVTVDPATDSPQKLAEYVGQFGSHIVGLTGAPETLAEVQRAYGIYAQRVTGHGGAETLAHTPLVFGIDRAGRLQVLMHPEEGDDVLRDDIETLMRIE